MCVDLCQRRAQTGPAGAQLTRRHAVLGGFVLPGLLLVGGGRVKAPPEVLEHFEKIATKLTDSYPYAPVPATAQAVRRDLPIAHAILAEGGLDEEGLRRMHAAAGRLAAMLGNAQLDTGWTGQASRTLIAAYDHAVLGKDAAGQAWCRLLQSSVELAEDQPRQALVYARDGWAVAPPGSPVAARLAAECIAASLAKLGDQRGTSQALDDAWTIVGDFAPEQRGHPGWHPNRLHPAELDSITAAAYIDAGNPHAALLHTERGIAALDRAPAVSHRAYVRTNAARAMLARDEIESAVDYMNEALEVSSARKLADIERRACAFVVSARNRAPGPLIENLKEHVRLWRATRLTQV